MCIYIYVYIYIYTYPDLDIAYLPRTLTSLPHPTYSVQGRAGRAATFGRNRCGCLQATQTRCYYI